MSPVLHPHPHGAHPEASRILGISAAIALNASVLLLALRPIPPQLRIVHDAPLVMTILVPPKAPVAPKPMPPVQPMRHPAPTADHVAHHTLPVPTRLTTPVSRPVPVAHDTPVRSPVTQPVAVVPQPAAGTPVRADLAYVRAPPPAYPMQARRMHMQGTVMLRVLVDAEGRPQQVEVASSSGYALLDRVARTQVLEHWLFRPAQLEGRHMAAWAIVPVRFNLR